jgi:hypothetical protein
MRLPVAKKFFRQIIEGLILEGHINPRGKSEEELREEVVEFVEKNIAQNHSFAVSGAINHTPIILRRARDFARGGELQISCLFYATWFEHWLNHLVAVGGRRKKLSQQEIVQIVREVQFRGKSTWLLRLLELKPINEGHLKKINDLLEARNSYVHYKWKTVDMDDPAWDKQEEPFENALKDIEKTVSYLLRLENRQFFHGKKRSVLF